MAKVYLKFNAAVIKEVELSKDETTFGRKPSNDIVIDHPTVSGFHGKIKKDAEGYLVEDLKSTNGTFVNGKRITTSALKHKDQIGVASHILEFVTEDIKEYKITPASPSDSSPGTDSAPQPKTAAAATPAQPAPVAEVKPDSVVSSEAPATNQGPGVIKIVSGAVDGQTEVRLKELVTYIGSSTQAAIKIQGFLAPDLAAAISRRPEGYFLKAVKPGYPKVNGLAIKEQIFLENGASIEAGGTNMVFYNGEHKKQATITDEKPKTP